MFCFSGDGGCQFGISTEFEQRFTSSDTKINNLFNIENINMGIENIVFVNIY